jgi:membrane carboxypeptidase/penicillin-binding protein PbpC
VDRGYLAIGLHHLGLKLKASTKLGGKSRVLGGKEMTLPELMKVYYNDLKLLLTSVL